MEAEGRGIREGGGKEEGNGQEGRVEMGLKYIFLYQLPYYTKEIKQAPERNFETIRCIYSILHTKNVNYQNLEKSLDHMDSLESDSPLLQ